MKQKYKKLIVKNPYDEGYCLVGHLPEEALDLVLDAIPKEEIIKKGIVTRYGLVKYFQLPQVKRAFSKAINRIKRRD